jgi:4-amino-4-deoxy-L-arabinose transferase-like glycosyltransferase
MWWLAVLGVMGGIALLRWRLLDVPLERDEGEYAYAAQLILQGYAPYDAVYNMKLPGIFAAYAVLIALFGETHGGIHLGLLFVNAATAALLFLLGRRLISAPAGLVAAAAFGVLSVGRPVQGLFANAEHFVMLPAVGGLLLLERALASGRRAPLAASGLLLGLGFLMKQHGVAFVAFGGLYLLVRLLAERPRVWRTVASACSAFGLGALLPWVVTCALLLLVGAFGAFWFWTVEYARAYVGQMPLSAAPGIFLARAAPILEVGWVIWGLAGLGLTAIVWDPRVRARGLFLALFALFSLLATCPGLFFRPHYFVLTLPAAALLAGAGVDALARLLARTPLRAWSWGVAGGVAVLGLATSLAAQRDFLFRMSPAEASRATYGLNPFPESLEIARFIEAHTGEDDRIAVLGSEPQLYFYSRRRAATRYIYTYPLMEEHEFALRMQDEMIREIEATRPSMLVFVAVMHSWLPRQNSHRRIFDWYERFQAQHYRLVGLTELYADGTVYRWEPDVSWPPRSQLWIAVLKRRV